MNCITSYWLLCEHALDGITSSVANYLSEKCVMIGLNTLGASVITLDKTQFVDGVALSNATCLSQLG